MHVYKTLVCVQVSDDRSSSIENVKNLLKKIQSIIKIIQKTKQSQTLSRPFQISQLI